MNFKLFFTVYRDHLKLPDSDLDYLWGALKEDPKREIYLSYVALAVKFTPDRIKSPIGWLKKAFMEKWDVRHDLRILSQLQKRKVKPSSLSKYQKTWDVDQMDDQEREMYRICHDEFGIKEYHVLRWIRLHEHFNYASKLYDQYYKVMGKEREPAALYAMIEREKAGVLDRPEIGTERWKVFLKEVVEGEEYDAYKREQRDNPGEGPLNRLIRLKDFKKEDLVKIYEAESLYDQFIIELYDLMESGKLSPEEQAKIMKGLE